jgi:hypothetical protein
MTGTTFTFNKSEFQIVEVKDNMDAPNVREMLIASGRDGNIYIAKRILKGRQNKNMTPWFTRTTTGTFDTLI